MYDILDLHTHTTASGHAYNSLYEMIHAAADKGLTLYGCSDHAPAMPGSCEAFHFINFKVIPRELFGVKILMGVELNILDFEGNVDLSPDYLARMDYCIASLHPPCFKCGTREQNTQAYLRVLENPHIQIIGHPDDGRFPIDYEALVTAAKRCVASDLRSLTDSQGELEGFYLAQVLDGLDYGPMELAELVEDVTKEDIIRIAQSVECDMIYFLRGLDEEEMDDGEP